MIETESLSIWSLHLPPLHLRLCETDHRGDKIRQKDAASGLLSATFSVLCFELRLAYVDING